MSDDTQAVRPPSLSFTQPLNHESLTQSSNVPSCLGEPSSHVAQAKKSHTVGYFVRKGQSFNAGGEAAPDDEDDGFFTICLLHHSRFGRGFRNP